MDMVISLVVSVAAFALSAWLGRMVGLRCRSWPAWRYWAANAVGLALGAAVCVVGLTTGERTVWMASLAVMAGSVTGLKYGLGEVVHQWKAPKDSAAR